MSIKTCIISIIVLLTLGMVGGIAFAVTTHFAGASTDAETVELTDVREDIVKGMYDSDGKWTDSGDKMASAASDNPGGFGGYYFDDNDPFTVYVYMKDTSQRQAAETALRAALYKDSQYTNIVPVVGKYAMDDLVSWHRQLLASLSDNEIDIGTTFIAHESNAFHVDIVDEGNMNTVWGLVDDLGIPRGAVILGVGGEWELLSAEASENVDTIDLTEVKEDAIKNLFDADGRMKNPHREMQNTVKDYDGGFGGYYFDPDNPTTAYVYMKDTTKTAEAEDAFREVYSRNAKFTTVVAVPGAYTVDELTDWFYQAVEALDATDNVLVTSASMNIMENEFQLSVKSDAQLSLAWAVIDDLGIPRGAVDLTVGIPSFN